MSCNEAQAENPALREETVMAVYTLPDLPYDYAGLEPVISGEILERPTGRRSVGVRGKPAVTPTVLEALRRPLYVRGPRHTAVHSATR